MRKSHETKCESAEEAVDFAEGDGAAQVRERSLLGDFPRRVEKTCPRSAGERAPDADPPNAGVRHLRHVREIASDENVDRLRRDRFDDRCDVSEAADAGRVKAIGARFGESSESANRLREIGTSNDEPFRSRGARLGSDRQPG